MSLAIPVLRSRPDVAFDSHGAKCVQILCQDCPLVDDAALSLYRIAQEALHNVVKHSGASIVTMRFDANPEVVSLTVADNGAGFDASRESTSNGIGVLSMKERARMLRGHVRNQSGPRAQWGRCGSS